MIPKQKGNSKCNHEGLKASKVDQSKGNKGTRMPKTICKADLPRQDDTKAAHKSEESGVS